jgi:hypothetical protein
MRARSGTTALVAGIFAGAVGLAAPAASQTATAPRDSTHHFSLFGGVAATEWSGPENGFALGASGDFRWAPVPVPLRFSLSFSQREEPYMFGPQRGGQASLDLVMRPIQKKFGIQPYFLGGLGVATRAPYSGIGTTYVVYDPTGPTPPATFLYTRRRETWAFAAAGVGLDVGRLFLQLKYEQPVASQGPAMIPLSVGFRFWD